MKAFKRWLDPLNNGMDAVVWDDDTVSWASKNTRTIVKTSHYTYDDLMNDQYLDLDLFDVITNHRPDIIGDELPGGVVAAPTPMRGTVGPRNNDGSLNCRQCGELTHSTTGFSSTYNLCSNKSCVWYDN